MEKQPKQTPEEESPFKEESDRAIADSLKNYIEEKKEAIPNDESVDSEPKGVEVNKNTKEKPLENTPKEKSFSEVNFGNKENKNLFSRLSDKVKEKITITKIEHTDRGGFLYNRRLENVQKENIFRISVDVEYKDKEIEDIKARLRYHTERMEALKDKLGPLDPNVENEANKERNKLNKTLREAESSRKILNAKKELYEAKRQKYETTKEEITNNVRRIVDEKIRPYKENIDNFNVQKDALSAEVSKFKEEKESWQNKLKDLVETSEGVKFKFEKIAFKEIEKEIKTIDYNINSVRKDRAVVNGRIKNLKAKIGYWDSLYLYKKSEIPKKEEGVKNTKDEKVKEWYEASGLSSEDMNNVVNEESQEKEYDLNIGDEVSWESQGILQWKEPKKIISIKEDPESKKMYALFEGETTGAPLDELTLAQEIDIQKENIEKVESNETPLEDKIEDNLEKREVSADEYIRRWNKLFGGKLFASNLKLDSVKLLDVLDMPKGIKKLPLKRVEEGIIEYNKNQGYFSRISKDELNRMFKIIRDTQLLGENSKNESRFNKK